MLIVSTTLLTDEIQQQLRDEFKSVEFQFFKNSDQAIESLAKADVLMTYGSDLKEKHITSAEQLKWIMVLSAGIDKMPTDLIKERDIIVTNVKGIHKTPMAEYAISMLLNYYRNNLIYNERQKEKHWDKSMQPRELANTTLTVVGAGAIGEELARLAKAFRMKTIAVTNSGGNRPYFDEVYQNKDLKKALSSADTVVSILPSTKETEGYYQAQQFEWMKNSAVFLNMGRGSAVSEETLIDALDRGELEHVILDVTPIEPLPEESPLWHHEKVTITPHISGNSKEYVPRAIEIFKKNLTSYLEKTDVIINRINLDRGY